VPHGFLALLMMGMSAAWVHGFGFVPQNRILRVLFSPLVAWPVILIGVWGVFLR
jgi:predicted membrane protein